MRVVGGRGHSSTLVLGGVGGEEREEGWLAIWQTVGGLGNGWKGIL